MKHVILRREDAVDASQAYRKLVFYGASASLFDSVPLLEVLYQVERDREPDYNLARRIRAVLVERGVIAIDEVWDPEERARSLHRSDAVRRYVAGIEAIRHKEPLPWIK